MPTEGTTRLTRFQVAVAKQALRDGLELCDQTENGSTIHYHGDQYGRIVEDGEDITDMIRKKQRDYKKVLAALEGR